MRRTLVGALLGALFVISLLYALAIPLERHLGSLVHPAGGWLYRGGVELRMQLQDIRAQLFNTNSPEQQAEITKLRLELIEQQRLQEQNHELRRELGLVEALEYDAVTADIVNYHPDVSREMLRIQLPDAESVAVGDPVVAGGVLLGVVERVDGRFAEVLLVSDIEFRALVEVEGASGVLSGQVGRELLIESLPRNQGVEQGSLVVTSGQDGVYPRGLLIGSVRDLSTSQGGVFDRATVDPEKLARHLQIVTVLRL